MKDLVTAIITTRNRSDLLKIAIESVLNQTYSNIELIIVDDGSIDNTKSVCEFYDLRYIFIPSKESKGGNYARNLGVHNARGKYVAFLDDDDEWLPTKIEKQINLIKEKSCSFVYCLRYYHDYSQGKLMRIREEIRFKPSGDLSEIIFRHYITNTSCILAEKRLIEEVGGFDEKLRKWQEYDLMIRIAQKTNIYHVDEYLCNYRSDVSDSERISNDFDRVVETIAYFKEKYNHEISALPLKTRIYFLDMCNDDTYKLAKKTNRKALCWKLYFPHMFFLIFKSIDDFSVAKRSYGIIKKKIRVLVLPKT